MAHDLTYFLGCVNRDTFLGKPPETLLFHNFIRVAADWSLVRVILLEEPGGWNCFPRHGKPARVVDASGNPPYALADFPEQSSDVLYEIREREPAADEAVIV